MDSMDSRFEREDLDGKSVAAWKGREENMED